MNNALSFENEINKIREELFNESKTLTLQQRTDKINALARETAEKYGLIFVASAKKLIS